MSRLTLYRPHAKINLGLEVLGLRPDGYHEVRTVLQTVALSDTLEVHPAPSEVSLECSDPALPTGEGNLAVKAARLLRAEFGCGAGARLVLTKRIPSQAGLGGGSSDAAAALMALAKLWKLSVDPARLAALAAKLGSDVPFFLVGGTALGLGRGEEVYPLPDAPAANLVLAWGAQGMPTAEAYRIVDGKLTAPRDAHTIFAIVRGVVNRRLSEKSFHNRFEEAATHSAAAAEARSVQDALLAAGATRVLLCGSGAAWAGFFPTREAARKGSSEVARRGFSAAATQTVGRSAYWEQALPGLGKEWLP